MADRRKLAKQFRHAQHRSQAAHEHAVRKGHEAGAQRYNEYLNGLHNTDEVWNIMTGAAPELVNETRVQLARKLTSKTRSNASGRIMLGEYLGEQAQFIGRVADIVISERPAGNGVGVSSDCETTPTYRARLLLDNPKVRHEAGSLSAIHEWLCVRIHVTT